MEPQCQPADPTAVHHVASKVQHCKPSASDAHDPIAPVVPGTLRDIIADARSAVCQLAAVVCHA